MTRGADEVEGLPPPRLRYLTSGVDADWFVQVGEDLAQRIRSHIPVDGDVLEFGCGCGRVARYFPGISGCDYNPELVAWCQQNLDGDFRVNDLRPPSPYEDESFDSVYVISVLTHLTEELCERWVDDWARILRPGGHLLVTVHGDAYRHMLGRRLGERYDSGKVAVHNPLGRGRNVCSTFHPPEAMRALLEDRFAEVTHHPGRRGEMLSQDVWVGVRR